MKLNDLASTARLSSLAETAVRNAPALHHPHHDAMESIREADYNGHHIVIRTQYQIEVDGVRVEADLHVGNDGRVHYHAIPTIDFKSAVDLVKKLIDTFPDDFQSSGSEHNHNHH